MSPSEQAPGPRGSPQDPQAPLEDEDEDAEVADGLAEDDEPFAATANTESCGASLVDWHFGHSAFCLP